MWGKGFVSAVGCGMPAIAFAVTVKCFLDLKGAGWAPLFKADLSDAKTKPGVWTVEADGVITASADEAIWTAGKFGDFILDLEFKTADGSNSGVADIDDDDDEENEESSEGEDSLRAMQEL